MAVGSFELSWVLTCSGRVQAQAGVGSAICRSGEAWHQPRRGEGLRQVGHPSVHRALLLPCTAALKEPSLSLAEQVHYLLRVSNLELLQFARHHAPALWAVDAQQFLFWCATKAL